MLTVLSSDRIILPLKKRLRPRSGRRMTLSYGRGGIVHPDGSIDWLGPPELVANALANEGEESVLKVYFKDDTNPQKYLALLTATPSETTTMATMTEVKTPGVDGYDRVEITTSDWGAPSLDSGDYMTTAAQKTFGPCDTNDWTNFTYVCLVTAATGTSGKFISYIALSGATTITDLQSFLYTMSQKAQ